MNAADDLYRSQRLRSEIRHGAGWVWAAGFAVVSSWVALILAAPLLRLAGYTDTATYLYSFFSYLCHQLPERTFHLSIEPMGVCTRCFGVYLGIVLGFAAYPIWRDLANPEPPARFWLFAALVPAAVDWSLTILGVWENTAASRCITGLILGFACATFIVPALIEIFQNLAGRRLNAAN